LPNFFSTSPKALRTLSALDTSVLMPIAVPLLPLISDTSDEKLSGLRASSTTG
jgi:hypothetical protein